MVEQLLTDFSNAASGQLIDKTRVIDALLDIRTASEDLEFVAEVDKLLADVPGKTVVATIWWKATLGDLKHQVARANALV